jgi:hypothetical protein
MAKTAAERQAAYRANRPFAGQNGNGERRMNTWIDTKAALALARLANRYGVTQREMIERLIMTVDDEIVAGLELDTQDWNRYFNVTQ